MRNNGGAAGGGRVARIAWSPHALAAMRAGVLAPCACSHPGRTQPCAWRRRRASAGPTMHAAAGGWRVASRHWRCRCAMSVLRRAPLRTYSKLVAKYVLPQAQTWAASANNKMCGLACAWLRPSLPGLRFTAVLHNADVMLGCCTVVSMCLMNVYLRLSAMNVVSSGCVCRKR